MATLSFKKLYLIAVPLVFGFGAVYARFIEAPSIAMVERLSGGSPLVCIFHWITDLDCPGCGLTRSLLSSLLGDLWLSFYFHPLGPLIALTIVVVWWALLFNRQAIQLQAFLRSHMISFLCIVLAWGILRNL